MSSASDNENIAPASSAEAARLNRSASAYALVRSAGRIDLAAAIFKILTGEDATPEDRAPSFMCHCRFPSFSNFFFPEIQRPN